MLNKEIIITRLALIKQLYRMGLDLSRQFEPLAAFSILSFHDSIEMFLKLVAENNDIKAENFNFLDYWDKFPTLTLKESLRSLNSRRVNIKHKGLLPSKADIEISRVNTTDFFEQNVFLQFGIQFNEVSLLSLINYNKVKEYLEVSQDAFDKGKMDICIEKSALAFSELLHVYEDNKWGNFRSPTFFFGKDMSFLSSHFMQIEDNKMADFVDTVKESVTNIQDAIRIISFGIDYRKYIKFKLLTPFITRMGNGNHVAELVREKKWTKENCQYCIDFVVDCSLKLQEFDFDIEELEDQKTSFKFLK